MGTQRARRAHVHAAAHVPEDQAAPERAREVHEADHRCVPLLRRRVCGLCAEEGVATQEYVTDEQVKYTHIMEEAYKYVARTQTRTQTRVRPGA